MSVIDPTQTVKEFATATLRDRLIRESTLRSYMQSLWLLKLDDVPMGDVTLSLLYRSLLEITNMNTRRKHTVVLRSVFRDVVPNLKELKIPKASAKVYHLPTEGELRFVLMMSPMEFQGLLMMYAGLRVGEACAITPKDIQGNILTVHKQRDENGHITLSKTQGEVVVPEWLAERIRTTEPRIVTPGSVRESLRRYSNKTGITVMCHMLRHWYCTEMVNHRINPEIARRQMRHSDLKTTLGYYAQVQKSDVDDIVTELFSAGTNPVPKEHQKRAEPPLTGDQLDGVSCLVCGRDDRPMKPLTTVNGGQVFACTACLPD